MAMHAHPNSTQIFTSPGLGEMSGQPIGRITRGAAARDFSRSPAFFSLVYWLESSNDHWRFYFNGESRALIVFQCLWLETPLTGVGRNLLLIYLLLADVIYMHSA